MKITVTESMFVDAFDKCGRGNNFSREARQELFFCLEESELDCGEETELDPIGICCEWREATVEECIEYYGVEIEPESDKEDIKEQVVEYINDNSYCIALENGNLLFMAF